MIKNRIFWYTHTQHTCRPFCRSIDVTVAGRYLLNGDFASPQPETVIKGWDEILLS